MYYTDRQVAILEFLDRYRRLRRVSPTLEEMAQHFGLSKVTIHDHVKQLERKGAVRREPHRARSLEVIDPEYDHRASASEPREEGRCPIAVLGCIAAGEPLEAIEDPEIVDLADLVPLGREHYALRVRGTSMIDDGIHDGDLVIVERRTVADDGEVVVAILDDEQATLKRLYRERGPRTEESPGGLRKGGGASQVAEPAPARYRLQPANDALDPIYVDHLEIRGVVVGVVRRL